MAGARVGSALTACFAYCRARRSSVAVRAAPVARAAISDGLRVWLRAAEKSCFLIAMPKRWDFSQAAPG